MVAIFGPHRNIVKTWAKYEPVFTDLVSRDSENGVKHLFQALIQFFINKYPEQQKFAATVCNILYDNSIIEDQFFIKWHAKQLKLDRDSKMFDKRGESAMRALLTDFIGYLSNSEYGEEEDGYGEEEGGDEAATEETKAEEPAETEA